VRTTALRSLIERRASSTAASESPRPCGVEITLSSTASSGVTCVPGDRVPHALAPCNALNDGETYLISINCRPDVDLDCRILWSNRFDRPWLLGVLDHLHRETHERILAKSVAWLTGRISHFASTLSHLDYREIVRNEIDAFFRLARVFPRGIEEQFDAMQSRRVRRRTDQSSDRSRSGGVRPSQEMVISRPPSSRT